MGSSPSVEAVALGAFRGALEEFGYVDGQPIVIEPRYAMGQPERFGSLARELVALAPSVIACVGRQETAALQAATRLRDRPRARARRPRYPQQPSRCWRGPAPGNKG